MPGNDEFVEAGCRSQFDVQRAADQLRVVTVDVKRADSITCDRNRNSRSNDAAISYCGRDVSVAFDGSFRADGKQAASGNDATKRNGELTLADDAHREVTIISPCRRID